MRRQYQLVVNLDIDVELLEIRQPLDDFAGDVDDREWEAARHQANEELLEKLLGDRELLDRYFRYVASAELASVCVSDLGPVSGGVASLEDIATALRPQLTVETRALLSEAIAREESIEYLGLLTAATRSALRVQEFAFTEGPWIP